MWTRLYPKLVTLVGGAGLGLALTYFVGVVLAFLPKWEQWAEFFVPLAIPLMVVPAVLLILHLVLRNHVGRFLLNRRAGQQAADYAQHRLNRSLLRSPREVANHRLVCVRAHVGLGDYETARQLLEEADDLPGSYAVEARRWRFELALREDNRENASQLTIEDPDDHPSARGELAALLGCAAELALREGDRDDYQRQMEWAIADGADSPRLRLVRALAMLQDDDTDPEEIETTLEAVEQPIADEIPARRAELLALRALPAWRTGRKDHARTLLEQARDGDSDHWTDQVIEDVAETIE